MTLEDPPFEDVFRIENEDFPVRHVSFREGKPVKCEILTAFELKVMEVWFR